MPTSLIVKMHVKTIRKDSRGKMILPAAVTKKNSDRPSVACSNRVGALPVTDVGKEYDI